MTVAEAERIAREVLGRDLSNPLWPGFTESDWADDSKLLASAVLELAAELARKDEALRHLAGVAEHAYGKALIEYRHGQPDARPEECWAEFEALGDVAAGLGEQP